MRRILAAFTLAAGIAPLGGLLPVAQPLIAQTDPGEWSIEAEVGGTVFYGNREQNHFNVGTQIEREDALFESATEFRFTYGTAPDAERKREVVRRSWVANSSLDFQPNERIRPFVSGRMESSFEREIGLRYDAGTGFKFDHRIDRDNRTEFSVSILAERTYSRSPDADTRVDDVSLARFSSDFRFRRTVWGDRVGLDLRAVYRPVFDAFGDFTFSSRNAISLELTEIIALRFSLRHEYDSGAVERGADTNRDGQVQMSVVAGF